LIFFRNWIWSQNVNISFVSYLRRNDCLPLCLAHPTSPGSSGSPESVVIWMGGSSPAFCKSELHCLHSPTWFRAYPDHPNHIDLIGMASMGFPSICWSISIETEICIYPPSFHVYLFRSYPMRTILILTRLEN
jgi:hypothetical protein